MTQEFFDHWTYLATEGWWSSQGKGVIFRPAIRSPIFPSTVWDCHHHQDYNPHLFAIILIELPTCWSQEIATIFINVCPQSDRENCKITLVDEDNDCAIAVGVFLHEAPDEPIISPHMLLIPNKPEPTRPGRRLFKTCLKPVRMNLTRKYIFTSTESFCCRWHHLSSVCKVGVLPFESLPM